MDRPSRNLSKITETDTNYFVQTVLSQDGDRFAIPSENMRNECKRGLADRNEGTSPIVRVEKLPLAELVSYCRRSVGKDKILDFAAKQGINGIIRLDIQKAFDKSKEQARNILKRYKRQNVLATIERSRPQRYYHPECIRRATLSKSAKNNPITHTTLMDSVVNQWLTTTILPQLPKTELQIHKLNFRTRLIDPEDYFNPDFDVVFSHEKHSSRHKADYFEHRIGNIKVKYFIYRNGTIMIYTSTSKTPFRVKVEEDKILLWSFIGQIRDRLALLLKDDGNMLVPPVSEWTLTQWDANRDITISHSMQLVKHSVTLRHLDRLFQVYIKSLGPDTVIRFEEQVTPKAPKSMAEILNGIWHPEERLEKRLAVLEARLMHSTTFGMANN